MGRDSGDHWQSRITNMREEGSGSPMAAAESITMGLQGTLAGRRQQLQTIKTPTPFLNLPLKKRNVGLCFGLGYTHSSQFGVQKGSPTTPYSHSVGLYSLSCLTEPRRTSSVVNNTCHQHVNVWPTSEQLLGSKCTNSP